MHHTPDQMWLRRDVDRKYNVKLPEKKTVNIPNVNELQMNMVFDIDCITEEVNWIIG